MDTRNAYTNTYAFGKEEIPPMRFDGRVHVDAVIAPEGDERVDIGEAQKVRREKRAQALKSRRRKTKVAKAEAEKARRGFIAGRRFILICVTASVVFFVGSSAFRIMELKAQEEEAVGVLEARIEQKARLESELAMLKDKEYIEEQARERLGMVKQGEILYIFEEKTEAPAKGKDSDADETESADDSDSGAARDGESEE
ncbi:MAG: septum formation initiator family protein [Clostridiales Family XIII bacterium]|jgi:cell division protein FtsB|nr:septum formation initiator family protein [Clostridiales Family XIII bacterium]